LSDYPSQCSSIYIGSGVGLPKGDFSIQYRYRSDSYTRQGGAILFSDYKLDVYHTILIEGLNYIPYMNLGVGSSLSPQDYSDYDLAEAFLDDMRRREWMTMTITYDRTNATGRWYHNAQLLATSTSLADASPTWFNESNVHKYGWFGKSPDGKGIEALGVGCQHNPSYTLDGAIDDLAVYNTVLSPAEIAQQHSAETPFDVSGTNHPHLSLYYSFNSNSNSTAGSTAGSTATPTTIPNLAPNTLGSYPLVLGVSYAESLDINSDDYDDATCFTPDFNKPVLVNANTSSSNNNINNTPPIPTNKVPPTVVKNSESRIHLEGYAIDLDGDVVSYQIVSLPHSGVLYETNEESLPMEMRVSNNITRDRLPYNQTIYVGNTIKYVHQPADKSNIPDVDSIVVRYTDGLAWSNAIVIEIHVLLFNDVPVPLDGVTDAGVVVREDSDGVDYTFSFVDYDSDVITIIHDDEATHGRITYKHDNITRMLTPFNQYNPYGSLKPIVQHGEYVTHWSSSWFTESGDWSAHKITGRQSVEKYADSSEAWCPENQVGAGISKNENDEIGREEYWDRQEQLEQNGITEYIEVSFETPVYIVAVEIGESRGCGSIVRLWARLGDSDERLAMYDDEPDVECDAQDGLARLTGLINKFSPQLCQPPFLADRVRIEMNTAAVPDWNELDYIKLTGYESPPEGVLPVGVDTVTYTPDANYFGDDSFSFYATDCAYHIASSSEKVTIAVSVTGVADPPVATKLVVDVGLANETAAVDLQSVVASLDNTPLSIEFLSLPTVGELRADGAAAEINVMYSANDTVFSIAMDGFPSEDTVELVEYRAVDETQGVSSKSRVEFVVQGTGVSSSGLSLGGWLAIAGTALVVIGALVSYFNVKQKRQTNQIMTLRSERMSMVQENMKLHEDLKIMQQYSEAEVNMIEAQITTFRKDFDRKSKGRRKAGDTDDDSSVTSGEGSLGADLHKLLISAFELESKEVIGKGSFGEVHRSIYRGTQVAVKTLNNVDEENLERFQAEILLMADLHHINVVSLVGACWERDLMALVMEYCDKGMSSSVLKAEGGNFSWDDPLLKWAMDIARALKYLHGVEYNDVKTGSYVSGIIHRDLKPDNCLVTETLTIKIADFGEARAFNENNTMTQVGTPMYISPEVVKGDHYGVSADIFSFALTVLCFALKGKETLLNTLFNMLVEEGLARPTAKVSLGKVCNMIVIKEWRPSKQKMRDLEIPETIVGLLEACWPNDPATRPPSSEILEYLEFDSRNEILGEGTNKANGSRRSSTSGGLRARISAEQLREGLAAKKADSGKVATQLKDLDEALFGGGENSEIREEEVEFAKKILDRWSEQEAKKGEGVGGGE
jgi:serine/threonine protein kinase